MTPDSSEQARHHGWLFALADGVGGHEKGEVASHAAVESVLEGFRDAYASQPLSGLLQRLVQAANTRVLDAGMNSRHGDDAGGLRSAPRSRCGRARGRFALLPNSARDATVLTRDHTVASEHERLGLLSADEAREAETRHVLSRSLGTALSVNVEINDHQVFPGDSFALLRWTARSADAVGNCHRGGQRRICTRACETSLRSPTKRTAAITSACNSSAFRMWNAWACTAAGPTSCVERGLAPASGHDPRSR